MTNELSREKSPYLLQHKDNPVHWKPWSPSAFENARKKDQLIFLSIGYATCHWCHVMEKDSFENESVATLLNANFVSIKVDREERPDVDSVYMQATLAMNGHGGWPMSLFLTPDGKVVWAGTFLPREQFSGLCREISRLWNSPTKSRMLAETDELNQWLQTQNKSSKQSSTNVDELIKRFESQMTARFDSEWGGFGNAPKFPQVPQLSLLEKTAIRSANSDLFNQLDQTLFAMARGGIQDHVDGGFHRYSTDGEWKLPHFEKMLYDNALLAPLYARRSLVHPEFKYIAQRTLDYVATQLTSQDGGFYCGEDADSEHVEGRFYVFTEAELKNILNDDEFELIKSNYQIRSDGNFRIDKRASALEAAAGYREIHGANVLHLARDAKLIPDTKTSDALKKLSSAKKSWARPLLDDKCLASWNGMMLQGLVECYIALEKIECFTAAGKSFEFIMKNFLRGDNLLRRYRDGESAIAGMLEDYAFVISGMLSWYQAIGEYRVLDLCQKLQRKQNELFWDQDGKGYFNNLKEDSLLPFRHKEFYDHAIANSNGISALNLNTLYRWTGDSYFKIYRDECLNTAIASASSAPTGCATIQSALLLSEPNAETIEVFYPDHFEGHKILCKTLRESKKNLIAGRVVIGKDKKIQYCQENACILSTEIV